MNETGNNEPTTNKGCASLVFTEDGKEKQVDLNVTTYTFSIVMSDERGTFKVENNTIYAPENAEEAKELAKMEKSNLKVNGNGSLTKDGSKIATKATAELRMKRNRRVNKGTKIANKDSSDNKVKNNDER